METNYRQRDLGQSDFKIDQIGESVPSTDSKTSETEHVQGIGSAVVKNDAYFLNKAGKEIKEQAIKDLGEAGYNAALNSPMGKKNIQAMIEERAQKLKQSDQESKQKISLPPSQQSPNEMASHSRRGKGKLIRKAYQESIKSHKAQLADQKGLDALKMPRTAPQKEAITNALDILVEEGPEIEPSNESETPVTLPFHNLSEAISNMKSSNSLALDSSGNFTIVDKKASDARMPIQDILKALDQGLSDIGVPRNEIQNLCKELKKNDNFKREIKNNPELKSQFKHIQNACSQKMEKVLEKLLHGTTEEGESNLAYLKDLTKGTIGDGKTMGRGAVVLSEFTAVLDENKGVFESLLRKSGLDSNKKIEIGIAEVKISNLFTSVSAEIKGSLAKVNQYFANFEDAAGMAVSRLMLNDSLVNVRAIAGTINKELIQHNTSGLDLIKEVNKTVDKFCASKLIEPNRDDMDSGEVYNKYEKARNNMIQEKLATLPGFEDFIKDRLEINEITKRSIEGEGANPAKLEELMLKINVFVEKYSALAEMYITELENIRKEVPLPTNRFDQAKDIAAQKNEALENMLAEYEHENTDRWLVKKERMEI